MKKIVLLLIAGITCIVSYAQTKTLEAYTFSVNGENFCRIMNGTPGAEAAFYSEKWGGKELKSVMQDATGELELGKHKFSPALVIDRGTDKVFHMSGPEFSINDMALEPGNGQRTISWKATADMNKHISFMVMRSTDGSKWEPVEGVAATKTPVELKYVINDAGSDATLYRIMVNNGKEVRYTSPTMSVSKNMAFVYPTVVNNRMTIELNSDAENVVYSISNISGQTVREGKLINGKNEINVTELSAGSYIVSIQSASIHLAEKIVKQ